MATKKSGKSKKETSKKKSKSSKKEDPILDIPDELAEEIQEAVAVEDAPSVKAAAKSTQIKISHYEEEGEKQVIEVGAAEPADEAEPVSDDKAETEPSKIEVVEAEDVDDVAVFAEDPVIDDLGDADDADEPVSEDNTDEDVVQDGHEWHLIDAEDEETVSEDVSPKEADSAVAESEVEADEDERPEWDEEQWMEADSKVDDESPERPEWDDEKWRAANIDEEETERPEWDEEQWMEADAKTDEPEVEAATATVDEEEAVATEAVTEAETEDDEASTDETDTSTTAVEVSEEAGSPEVEPLAEEEQDTDQLSASQVALNTDEAPQKRLSVKQLPKRLMAWWSQAKLRNSVVAGMAAVVILIVAVPAPRYVALNTVGVRATASVAVLDSETQLPLREVAVSMGDKEVLTNQNGLATFDDLKLGAQQMTITKSAYDTYTQSVTIGVGTNTIDPVDLISVGTSFDFKVVDWLTMQPILDAEVSFGENSAFVNGEGVAKLKTPTVSSRSIEVLVEAPGYVEKTAAIDTTTTDVAEVALVLSRRHAYISKRDGTYDVYKTYADGSEESLVLKGTGTERDDIRFDVAPSGNQAILVASRDTNLRNQDDFVLSGLFLIDLETDAFEMVDSSERIDPVGWIDETLIYVKIQAGASGRNPERHRLVGLDTRTGKTSEIAASNYFNDVIVAKDYVFYAPSDAYKQNPKPYLYRSNADGSDIETVFEKNVWTILRTGFDDIAFDSEQVWYEGKIDSIFNVQAETRPTNFASRLYTQNPSGSKAAWVDIRDGKGSLLLTNVSTGQDETLLNQSGLRNPIVWLSDTHLVFRVVTSDETADYVLNVNGGEPMKIRDVTDVSGTDRWYYYY